MSLQEYIDESTIEDCLFEVCEVHKNVTVVVCRCRKCGKIDIGWERQDNTIDEYYERIDDFQYEPDYKN